MARARNIKPAFFANDELAELEPIERLFFIGLWTISDFKGDIEWRPKKVKALVLPYDNCNVEKIAINLDKSGFIRFYSVQGVSYINITNFTKHQNPHKNEREKGSDIPKFEKSCSTGQANQGIEINRDKNGTAHDKNETPRADSLFLIPDSLNLIPDSITPQSEIDGDSDEDFNFVWDMYQKKGNRKTSLARFKRMKDSEKRLMAEHLPRYIKSTPEKQYRKNLEVYINQECWNDQILENSNEKATNDSRTYQTATDRARQDGARLLAEQRAAQEEQQADTENYPFIQHNV